MDSDKTRSFPVIGKNGDKIIIYEYTKTTRNEIKFSSGSHFSDETISIDLKLANGDDITPINVNSEEQYKNVRTGEIYKKI